MNILYEFYEFECCFFKAVRLIFDLEVYPICPMMSLTGSHDMETIEKRCDFLFILNTFNNTLAIIAFIMFTNRSQFALRRH